MLKLLPDLKDCDILADKAYGTKEIRTYLHDQSARYTIPPKVNTKQPWLFDKETYKRRNVIERFFNRLKEFRRAETRYDKRDDSFLAFCYGRLDLRRFRHFAQLSAVFRYTPVQKLLDDFEGHASVFLLSVAGMER